MLLAVATPMLMMAPIRAGTLQRRPGQEQEDHDAGQRRRQRGDDDEGVQPGLKVHDDQQVGEDDGEDEPLEQPAVRRPHGVELAAHGDEAAAGQE